MIAKFESFEEIVNNGRFKELVYKNVTELRSKRYNRPDPKVGYYYKRDLIDRMIEKRTLNADFFIKNILEIWHRNSNLSSNERRVITFICEQSLAELIAEYSKEEEKNEKEKHSASKD